MVQLSVIFWALIAFFAYVGWVRGFTKAIIALSGITLGLFGLYEFDTLIRLNLFDDLGPARVFYVQCAMFLTVVFFAYQTRALEDFGRNRGRREERDELQSKALGMLVGAFNGYMIGGSIWGFMINSVQPYPLQPSVVAPTPGSPSAALVENLPLAVLTQNGSSGDLLSLMVVILFVVVLVII